MSGFNIGSAAAIVYDPVVIRAASSYSVYGEIVVKLIKIRLKPIWQN